MKRLFPAIAIVMMLAVIACIYLLVPRSAWSATTLVSAAMLIVASGAWVFMPGLGGRDAQLALLGPAGVLGILLLISATLTLWFAVVGKSTIAAVMNVLNIAGLIIGYLVLRVASRMIARTVDSNARSEERRKLYSKVRELAVAIDDEPSSRKVRSLAEDIAHTPDSLFEPNARHARNLEELADGLAAAVTAKDAGRVADAISTLKDAIAMSEIETASKKM